MSLEAIALRLRRALATFAAPPPVCVTYDPLRYAWEPARAYLRRYGTGPKRALWVGMNPGPFGMAQTGVPFGDVSMVRDFLRIEGRVQTPAIEHPARVVQGFDCARREVSGTRLWGWAQAQFGEAEAFFEHYFVYNYCPLAFMEQSGRNFTPDKLPTHARAALFAACDDALVASIEALSCERVIGIGAFAAQRCRQALARADLALPVDTLLHPSPASPLANRGWAEQATRALEQLGLPVHPLARSAPRAIAVAHKGGKQARRQG